MSVCPCNSCKYIACEPEAIISQQVTKNTTDTIMMKGGYELAFISTGTKTLFRSNDDKTPSELEQRARTHYVIANRDAILKTILEHK